MITIITHRIIILLLPQTEDAETLSWATIGVMVMATSDQKKHTASILAAAPVFPSMVHRRPTTKSLTQLRNPDTPPRRPQGVTKITRGTLLLLLLVESICFIRNLSISSIR